MINVNQIGLSNSIVTGFHSPAPRQWSVFLQKHPEEDGPPETVVLTETRFKQLAAINVEVNSEGYVRDTDEDSWDLRTPGDCEDLALVKRHRLVRWHGWPVGALRIVVCKNKLEQGHALLCACTDLGDYFLDVNYPWFDPWFSFDYKLISRHYHDRVWEMILSR